MLVDTHVILMSDSNEKWWDECQDSLAGEPVNIHVIEGVKGHIGKGRVKGFIEGKSPYVSCVDPDDLIIPGAFEKCIEALEDNPEACGAYTDELLIDERGRTIRPGIWSGRDWNPLLQLEPQYLHHIYVMRRCFVAKHLTELGRWPHLAEFVLKGLLVNHGPWIHVDSFGYKWRMHEEGQNHKGYSLMDVYAARWRVIPVLQNAARKYRARIPVSPKAD